MKKQIFATAAILALSAGAAFAAVTALPGEGVKGSVHDMNASVGATDAQGRICAFCHTPHHAVTAVTAAPLWSRNDTTGVRTYVAYDSGVNGFQVVGSNNAPADPAFGPTRLCLTCHDSQIGSSTHYNTADGVTALLGGDSFGGVDIGLNSTLANDHPVGFSYGDVVCGNSPSDNTDNNPGTCIDGTKNYVRSTGVANDLKFKNNANISVGERLTNGIMTCATCHDVHNKKNKFATPDAGSSYLVLAPQKDSDLCLTCHIK
jgi:opacity protein-like surface antigen